MTKQVTHLRTHRKGPKRGLRYKAGSKPFKRRKGFYGNKRPPERYFLARDENKAQPIWHLKKPSDKDMTYYQLVEYRQYSSSPFGDADKDGVMNLFDMQPLNARNHKTMPPTVKQGNTKLTKIIGIFSLPRFYTCPGKTRLCSRYCYAEPPEYFRPGVVYSRNKNYAWTKRKDFVSVMSRIIKSLEFPWFRIHESGDFYNQEYLEKWKKIARNNPQTKFLAYTKNWKLDFQKLPGNLLIRYSCDVSSEHIREDLPICYVGVNQPNNFFLCRGKCKPDFCMACWEPADVFIPIHSISKKAVDDLFFKQFSPEIPASLQNRVKKQLDKIGPYTPARKDLKDKLKPLPPIIEMTKSRTSKDE